MQFRQMTVQGFNTQPPEGGWFLFQYAKPNACCFNTQPPEGGWAHLIKDFNMSKVSTHSRLKAAGWLDLVKGRLRIRFNTQPPEGGWDLSCH